MIDLDHLCINTIRMLSIDMVQEVNSGHPGMPMGAAPMAYVLWTRFLKHNPQNPIWPDRDRFVLSAGHGSALLYSLLHLCGYPLPIEEIKNFRQWGSKTPGHPEYRQTPGVESTTGPLGQGVANAIVSDGDLMEGVAAEAASLAGHLRLGKLIFLYDNNSITLKGFPLKPAPLKAGINTWAHPGRPWGSTTLELRRPEKYCLKSSALHPKI
ncbi:MAG: hypothetical protein KKH04_14920 [Proteobacteria bacterium]|nr:hypothetical protein [Pseudomonadota bacterium]